jgi:Holliday junction DNA helicase RuvA
VIGSLRGSLFDRLGDGEVLIDVGGIGYRVTVSPATVVQLGDVGDDVFVHIHHHIREDNQTLYGFLTADERVCFEALLGAHGVGPALALAILSVHDPVALARVLIDDDIGALCLVPGVGKKTAARLLIELTSRLDLEGLAASTPVGIGNGPGATVAGSPLADVRDALANLGYGTDEVNGALRDLTPDGDAPALLKQALQRLAVG